MRLPSERLTLMRQRGETTKRPRLPDWLRTKLPGGEGYARIKSSVRDRKLATVCEEAQCPNIGECWNEGTATMMLMGESCTRACRFCNVRFNKAPPPLDPLEPQHAAEQVERMGLSYIVITSVTRDDLPDGGAAHLAAVIEAIHLRCPETLVEVLTPDFQGSRDAIETVLDAAPQVFAHNVETVPSLQSQVRDRRASWQGSLDVLRHARRYRPEVITKTSLMVGMGETDEEIDEALRSLRDADVDAVTLGQYLRPSPWHHEVHRFVPPEAFESWRLRCETLGFRYAASGPLVRSSYRAGEYYLRSLVETAEKTPR